MYESGGENILLKKENDKVYFENADYRCELVLASRKSRNEPLQETVKVAYLQRKDITFIFLDEKKMAEFLKAEKTHNDDVLRIRKKRKEAKEYAMARAKDGNWQKHFVAPSEADAAWAYHLYDLPAATVKIDVDQWKNIVQKHAQKWIDRFGVLPQKPQLMPIFHRVSSGFQGCLKVTFKKGLLKFTPEKSKVVGTVHA